MGMYMLLQQSVQIVKTYTFYEQNKCLKRTMHFVQIQIVMHFNAQILSSYTFLISFRNYERSFSFEFSLCYSE